MDPRLIEELLRQVAGGAMAPEEAMARLRDLPFEDLGFAKIDHHRPLRKGYPETIFCSGKTPAQVVEIAARMKAHGNVLGTRCSDAVLNAVAAAHPEAARNETARTFTILPHPPEMLEGYVAVVCAGTSDLPVAEEAAVTLETMGCRVERINDVGVAGIHRLFEQRPKLEGANALIVCAGMEGALPSVVAGLVRAPCIGVPTSVGYGASFGGVAALLGMLNSCASGLTVVNIDNGFGAACAAAAIHRIANGVAL
ncbi:MAG: nickel pincer cofactor biosynthesis protein LarB [Candidatus Hydrogenedens sp.]|nr:nickel pincer cofactor biosynthesis protein LarB [Candidatus Hydrogenedens sp.]